LILKRLVTIRREYAGAFLRSLQCLPSSFVGSSVCTTLRGLILFHGKVPFWLATIFLPWMVNPCFRSSETRWANRVRRQRPLACSTSGGTSRQAPKAPLRITGTHNSSAGDIFTVRIDSGPYDGDTRAPELWLAITEDGLSTDVLGGENGSRKLRLGPSCGCWKRLARSSRGPQPRPVSHQQRLDAGAAADRRVRSGPNEPSRARSNGDCPLRAPMKNSDPADRNRRATSRPKPSICVVASSYRTPPRLPRP
jgi:hypothetical protein